MYWLTDLCKLFGKFLYGVKISGVQTVPDNFVEFNGEIIQQREIYLISFQHEADGQKYAYFTLVG